MSDFGGMDDLLQDFLIEAGDLLSDVDNRLVELERSPNDRKLLNDIFRGFHTIKGGAGFLNATELVTLCHLTENLFDKLRTGELLVTPECLDAILSATATVRSMFSAMEHGMQPSAADPDLIEQLELAIDGKLKFKVDQTPMPVMAVEAEAVTPVSAIRAVMPAATIVATDGEDLDWATLYGAVTGIMPAPVLHKLNSDHEPDHDITLADVPSEQIIQAAIGRRTSDKPGYQGNGGGRRAEERTRDNSIRVDTSRLDQVLNLSGEIGLTKNRLTALRTDIMSGKNDADTLHAIDLAVSQLDLLVSDLQNAVMKTRMQPIGRLFQKYPRIARDLARSLGKDVELMLEGEETEIDKTMIEDLADPIIHLIRNAVDHGVEAMEDRLAAGKPEKSIVKLIARQEGDHILLIVSDDGRGMNPERLRSKALEKGLISDEDANTMDERQSFNLIFLPGFSTVNQISDISGRGVGMDVVRTNIQKLNGTIDIKSTVNVGTTFIISLPLTLAILPVLVVCLDDQPFAVPLSMVREILPIEAKEVQELGGRATMVVRGEVLPVVTLAGLLSRPQTRVPEYGVLMQTVEHSFILAIDSFAGREDAVIKSLDDFRPKGVAGVTTLSNGQIVLILDMNELLVAMGDNRVVTRTQLLLENERYAVAA